MLCNRSWWPPMCCTSPLPLRVSRCFSASRVSLLDDVMSSVHHVSWDYATVLACMRRSRMSWMLCGLDCCVGMVTSWIVRHHQHRKERLALQNVLYGVSGKMDGPSKSATMTTVSSAELPVATIGGV